MFEKRNFAERKFMVKCRLLSAALVGTLFYVAVSMICGRDGMWAQNQLQEQKINLGLHCEEIKKTNSELELEKIALQNDMDVVAAYARKLGYVKDGEKLVKISGLAARETRIFDPGSVMRHTDVDYMPEMFCKSIGIFVFLLVYLVLVLWGANNGDIRVPSRKNEDDEWINSSNVYEMPQI